jgi:hypothetical protein
VADGEQSVLTTVVPPVVAAALNDPGGEVATATKERRGTLGRISDELFGPRSAYKRGGRQKHRGYDAGGAAPPSGANTPSLADFQYIPKANPITKFVQSNIPPLSVNSPLRPAPGFVNRQIAAQKNAQLKQRVKQLEKGR